MTIDEYLAELRRHLKVGPLARRRILREIETHLVEATAQELTAGHPAEQAERRAIERVGSPVDLAAPFPRARWVPVLASVAVAAATAAILFGAGGVSAPPASGITPAVAVLTGDGSDSLYSTGESASLSVALIRCPDGKLGSRTITVGLLYRVTIRTDCPTAVPHW